MEFRGRCVATSVRKRDFLLGTGVAAVEDGVIESFDAVSLGIEGAVNGAVGVVAQLEQPPVLTATPEASDVACAPVDVEDPRRTRSRDLVEELVEAPDGELVEAPTEELVEAPDEESDDELDGSACASPCPESTATPTPSMMIRPANRPIPVPPL